MMREPTIPGFNAQWTLSRRHEFYKGKIGHKNQITSVKQHSVIPQMQRQNPFDLHCESRGN